MPVGKMASDAVIAELARQAKVDIVPSDTVARQAADLGFQLPISKSSEIQRLGQALQAVTVVTGEIVNWRIVTKPEGRQAQVIMRMMVWDVAAGLTINGSAKGANSNVMSGDVKDEDLIKAALNQGAFDTLADVNSRTMPSATVLNTLQNRALINKGSRAGFNKDQRVVVTRGKSLVAEGIIRDVDPDSSFVETTRSFRGVQPGDRIRSIFDVPDIKSEWARDGSTQMRRPKSSNGSNSGLVSLVIVLLILGFLLANGHGSNQDGVGGVTAEALVLANDNPGVRVSWTRDSFFRGTNLGPFTFQVWRDDSTATPAVVAPANASSAINDRIGTSLPTWYDFAGVVGGNTCLNQDPPTGTGNAGVVAVPGTPYNYSVEVVYRVSCFDLPDTSNCTSGGGTSGNTGGTGSTGSTGTTGTGGTTGSTGTTGTGGSTGTTGGDTQYCYFATSRVAASGQATPLVRPTLRAPDDNAIVPGPITFGFTSIRGNVASVPIEYVVQFSDRQDFPANRTFTTDPFVELVLPGGQPVSSPTIDTTTIFPAAPVLYWRVGGRNPEDSPGPVLDAAGQRFIKSAIRHFRRPVTPKPTKR